MIPFDLASGRKQIIAEFKSLVSSFPDEMGSMQIQLRKYKESASDIHSLRADVKSVSSILDRKVGVFVYMNCTFGSINSQALKSLFLNNR